MGKSRKTGKATESNWLPSDTSISDVLTLAKNVIQTSADQWAFIGHQHIHEPDSCLTCFSTIPYMGMVTTSFDTMRWMTRFFALPYTVGLSYNIYTMTEVRDGFIGVGKCFEKVEGFERSAVIFKASLEGDCLWMKHIIHLGWDQERFLHGQLTDVTTTPSGSIIAVGEVADGELLVYHPWILHLDKDGCLVPGCNVVSGSDPPDPVYSSDGAFRTYPNPVHDQLYLLCTSCMESEYQVQVFTVDGAHLGTTRLTGAIGAQYTLTLEHLPIGSYHLVIRSMESGQMETHPFVKQ